MKRSLCTSWGYSNHVEVEMKRETGASSASNHPALKDCDKVAFEFKIRRRANFRITYIWLLRRAVSIQYPVCGLPRSGTIAIDALSYRQECSRMSRPNGRMNFNNYSQLFIVRLSPRPCNQPPWLFFLMNFSTRLLVFLKSVNYIPLI